MSSKIGTIKEQREQHEKESAQQSGCKQIAQNQNETDLQHQGQDQTQDSLVPHVDTLSLLSPDLNDVNHVVPDKNDTKPDEGTKRSEQNNECQINHDQTNEVHTNREDENVFLQFADYVVYNGTVLTEQNITEFLSEKEKLERKLAGAMETYQSNNEQYLSNIMQQYRTQKLKICQEITDGPAQDAFLKKLQKDLEILDDSLKRQFEESKNTLQNQLTTIHHKRLREFALKLQQHSEHTEEQKG